MKGTLSGPNMDDRIALIIIVGKVRVFTELNLVFNMRMVLTSPNTLKISDGSLDQKELSREE